MFRTSISHCMSICESSRGDTLIVTLNATLLYMRASNETNDAGNGIQEQQSRYLSIHRSIKQSINQSINQSIIELIIVRRRDS